MTINDASIELTLVIFGPDAAFQRLGRVRAVGKELHVRTCLRPGEAERTITTFAGYPVKWIHITKESAS